jgi:ABC-2 type transport system permease protein
MTDVATATRPALPGRGTGRSTPTIAFGALLLRDLSVLRKEFVQFMARTVMQPLLFVFVFAYVFPKIGQGVGGAAGSAAFSSILVPGVVAIACIFQGIQAVALPLVQDFGYSREIEDRVMAPLPVWAVAVEKVVAGAIQGLIAAAIVFPLALVVPATPVHLDVRPLLLFTLLPLAAFTAASLGLVLGTRVNPRQVPLLFGIVVIPIVFPLALVVPATPVHLDVRPLLLFTLLPLAAFTAASLGLVLGTRVNPRQVPLLFGIVVIPIVFLGATYYPWANLTPIPWLKALVLLNPLVYMSEGMRVSLTPWVPHMAYWAIYGGMIGFIAIFLALGIDGFRGRVLS